MKRIWIPLQLVRPGKAFFHGRTKYFRIKSIMGIDKEQRNLVSTGGELGFLNPQIAVKVEMKRQ